MKQSRKAYEILKNRMGYKEKACEMFPFHASILRSEKEVKHMCAQPETIDLLRVLEQSELMKERQEVESLMNYLDNMESQFGEMLPGKNGYEVCREIRDTIDIPILMVTARTESVDKIYCL